MSRQVTAFAAIASLFIFHFLLGKTDVAATEGVLLFLVCGLGTLSRYLPPRSAPETFMTFVRGVRSWRSSWLGDWRVRRESMTPSPRPARPVEGKVGLGCVDQPHAV